MLTVSAVGTATESSPAMSNGGGGDGRREREGGRRSNSGEDQRDGSEAHATATREELPRTERRPKRGGGGPMSWNLCVEACQQKEDEISVLLGF